MILSTLLPFNSLASESSSQKNSPYIKARVINEGANVYKAPNFDAEIIGDLGEGQKISIYPKKYNGIFYLVVFANGVRGYVADIDITLKTNLISENTDSELKKSKIKRVRPPKPTRPISFTSLHGFSWSSTGYREDTMSLKPKETLNFFGLKLSGPYMIDGIPTDFNFQFFSGAPKYYAKATGNQADGFILISDFIFITALREAKDFLFFYGFGPMVKHSEFNVTLSKKNYSLVDTNLGLAFTSGLAGRIGPAVLRSEVKFHWEKMTYWSWINSFQWSL